jgi:hypothetical protein
VKDESAQGSVACGPHGTRGRGRQTNGRIARAESNHMRLPGLLLNRSDNHDMKRSFRAPKAKRCFHSSAISHSGLSSIY